MLPKKPEGKNGYMDRAVNFTGSFIIREQEDKYAFR